MIDQCELCPKRDCCQSYIRSLMRFNVNRVIMEHCPDVELALGVDVKIGNRSIGRIASVVLRSDGSIHLTLSLEEQKIDQACQRGR